MTVIYLESRNSVVMSEDFRPREANITFDFGDGNRLVWPSGGEINQPRGSYSDDVGWTTLTLDELGSLSVQNKPDFLPRYVAGWVNDILDVGTPDNPKLIFIDHGREHRRPTEDSYLWQLTESEDEWVVDEFAQEIGLQFWHGSSNPIDLNQDGTKDFVTTSLTNSTGTVLFISNDEGSFDPISVMPGDQQGIAFLIELNNGRVASVTLPYSVVPEDPPWSRIAADSIYFHEISDGRPSRLIQTLDFDRGHQPTLVNDGSGFAAVKVVDFDYDGDDDFIAIMDDLTSGYDQQNYVNTFLFEQQADATFRIVNSDYNFDNRFEFDWSNIPNAVEYINGPDGYTGSEIIYAGKGIDGRESFFIDYGIVPLSHLQENGLGYGFTINNGVFERVSLPKFYGDKIEGNGFVQNVFTFDVNGDEYADFLVKQDGSDWQRGEATIVYSHRIGSQVSDLEIQDSVFYPDFVKVLGDCAAIYGVETATDFAIQNEVAVLLELGLSDISVTELARDLSGFSTSVLLEKLHLNAFGVQIEDAFKNSLEQLVQNQVMSEVEIIGIAGTYMTDAVVESLS